MRQREYAEGGRRDRVIAIVAGILLVAGLGFALGRGTVGAVAAPTAHTAAAPFPTASPIPVSFVDAPHPETNGVPTGFPDSAGGAIQAASAFDCVLGGPLVIHPDAFRAAVRTMAAPGMATTMLQAADATLTSLDANTGLISAAAAGKAVAVRCIPIGYRLETFTPSAAAVDVWTEQIVAVDQSLPPTVTYDTITLSLVWVGGDWRLAGSRTLDASWAPRDPRPGLPVGSSLPAQLGGFQPYSYQPGQAASTP